MFGMAQKGNWERVLRRAAVVGGGILAVRFTVAFLAGVAIEVWRMFG